MDQTMMDRVVLITGAGSGLGRATSREIAGAGAHVLVSDVDERAAKETVALVESDGGSAEAMLLDITDSAAVTELIAEAGARYGENFDCLINNAGTDRGSDLPEIVDDEWHHVFAVNVDGPMFTSRAFVQHVLGRSGQHHLSDIVNVGSISAVTVGSGSAAYNASKAALLKLTEIMQCEAREREWPVRVTALQPAAMRTPMMDQWHLPENRMMPPEVVARVIHSMVTLPPQVVMQQATITMRNEYFPR